MTNSYVGELTEAQAERLREILDGQGWEFSAPPYTRWQARKDKTSVTAYLSGKLNAQGRGVEDLVLYILEPEILNDFSWSIGQHEAATAAADQPDPLADYVAHAGLDESGKGDYFGPLVIACAYLDAEAAAALVKAGVRDSKAIKSDQKIRDLAAAIMRTAPGQFAVVAIGPEAYNRLYAQFGNLNRMLAWGHARALENLLEKVPQCEAVLADKFGDESLIRRALLTKGRNIRLDQRTKAESDPAVAAASILARNGFIHGLDHLSQEAGLTLPRGAGPAVLECGRQLIARHGTEALGRYAKLHFQTTQRLLEPQ